MTSQRKPLGDISNNSLTPPPHKLVSPQLLSARDEECTQQIKTPASKGVYGQTMGPPSKLELDKSINKLSTPGPGNLSLAWQQLTPRTPHQSESFLSEDVQLTPPECKAMLSAINSAVDATEDKPGASESLPNSLEGWLLQVGITDTVSGTLKEQLQILYDRACESARLRSFMEAMKINELEMAAHEADDTARQMDLLADENTFLYEAKSSLMSDNELLRRQLQEAQARLESRMELQMQALQQQQQQQYQQQQQSRHLLLEPSGNNAQQQQQQMQLERQMHLASGQGRAMVPPVPPTPALIHTPAMTQASTLLGPWVTTRQGPFAPSPGLSALSIRTPNLDETEAWMQLDASFAAQRAITPLETPSLQDALAWVDGPSAHSAPPRAHHTAFGSPQSTLCPAANNQNTHAANNNGSSKDPPVSNHGHPAVNNYGSPATNNSGPAANNEVSPDCQPADQAPGTGAEQPMGQLPSQKPTLRQAYVATTTPSSALPHVDRSLTTACAATTPTSVAAPATAGAAAAAAAAARVEGLAAFPPGALAPDLGAFCSLPEQTGSSNMDAAAAACSPAAPDLGRMHFLPEQMGSSNRDAAAAACSPAAPAGSSSMGIPAGSAPLLLPAAAEVLGEGVSSHHPHQTAAKEPGVGVALLAGDQETVHLCMTPAAHTLAVGATSTPAAAGNATSPIPWAAPSPSVLGSEISFGSCGAAGFASAVMGSATDRLQHSSLNLVEAESLPAGVASPAMRQGQVADGSKATACSPPAAASGTRCCLAAAVTTCAGDQNDIADQLDQTSIQPACVPSEVQISTQDTLHSTPCVSAQFATPLKRGGSVAFQTPLSGRASFQTGASAFASATRSVTSKPPANAWDGNRFDAASALSFTTPSTQPCEPASSTAATHDSSDSSTHCPTQPYRELCLPSSSTPALPAPPQQIPFAAAFFNAFSAAFKSVPTPVPPTRTKASSDADAAPPLCSPAAGDLLKVAVAQAPFPAEAASPALTPNQSPAGSREGLKVNVAQAEPPTEAASPCFPPHHSPGGSQEGPKVNVAQAAPPAEAASPPFPPHHSPAGSLGEAAGKIGNSAWALLCSDEEEEAEEEEREEGKGVKEAQAAADSKLIDEAETKYLHATENSPHKVEAGSVMDADANTQEIESQSAADAAASSTKKAYAESALHVADDHMVEAVSTLHATTYSPGESYADPALHTKELDSQLQVPSQPTPIHQQNAAAAQGCALDTAQDYTPGAPTWGILHYEAPEADASRASNHATPPCQAATYPLKPLACPWGPQLNCHSASPTLQHHTCHPSSEISTKSSGISSSGGSARYKPLCLNWCSAPSTKSRGVPGGPVRVCSTASAPSTCDNNSLGPHELSSDAESIQAISWKLDTSTSTPARAASEQQAALQTVDNQTVVQPQQALQAEDKQQGGCSPATPANMSGTPAGMRADQAPLEQVGAARVALALDLNTAVGAERRAEAQQSPAHSEDPQPKANAGIVTASAAEEAHLLEDTSSKCNSNAPGMQMLPLEAASGPDEGKTDAEAFAVRDQQTKRSSRWGCRMTEEQEKEVRRRAAALKIHISPYFKSSRSRRATAQAMCDVQDI